MKFQIAKPFIDQRDEKGVLAVLRSGNLSLGPRYQEFEKDLAHSSGVKYACAVANGTCGLHLAVRALGLGDGDEVITSPFSFISSSNCLLFERATPVFVDIEETTFNMDPARIEQAITQKTKAILVVHIFGQSADMTAIQRIARKHKLAVIDDACESLGSSYKGKAKIEDTGAGDYMRDFPPQIPNAVADPVNPAFQATNRGKRSVAIDLKHARGRELLLALAESSDALIESFRPGVLARRGLGWDTLHARNPRLVLCWISGYGQNGPGRSAPVTTSTTSPPAACSTRSAPRAARRSPTCNWATCSVANSRRCHLF